MAESFTTTRPDGEVKIRMGTEGIAAAEPVTVVTAFKNRVQASGSQPALKKEYNGEWKTWSWQEYYDECFKCAKSLIHLGLKPHDAVCIIGFNSPEWFFADMGCIMAGGMASGIYTTNGPEACKYIAEHSGSAVAVVEGAKQLEKFQKIRSDLPKLKAIVVYGDSSLPENAGENVYLWDDFMKLGAEVTNEEVEKRMDAQRPGHCCTLIYTSGTTGNPKAVMCSHDNITWIAQCTLSFWKEQDPSLFPDMQRFISYLPLSHIAAQMLDIHFPMHLPNGCCVWFARPDALKGSLGDTLKAVRPTIFFGVPRVWEKFMEKMKAVGAKTQGLKKTISTWAKSEGLAEYQGVQGQGRRPSAIGYGIANWLVFDNVKAALGLGEAKIMVTGAAPIAKETLEYFGSLGIHVLELYGMSECTGPHTVSELHKFRTGSCGSLLTGCEMKLDKPDDEGNGEICMRGRHVMMGYMNNDAATRETIDEEGYLHSGDIGQVRDGLLFITGRIKELIITAGGENVAPVPIEDAIKAAAPAISNCVVIGDKRKFLTCLVTLKLEQNMNDGTFTEKLIGEAASVDPECKTIRDALKSDKFKAHVQAGLDANNKAAVSNAQKVQKFRILSTDFSEIGGEMTPTMKLKRRVIPDKYHKEIESMYA